MNRIYRVIWNQAQRCFVVVSELTRSRGKPASARNALATAVTALIMAPGIAGAAAVSTCANPLTTTSNVICTYTTDDTIDITSTGEIVTVGRAVAVNPATFSSLFVNDGLLRGTLMNDTDAVRFYNVSGSVTNNGQIIAEAQAGGGLTLSALILKGDLSGIVTNSSTGSISVTGSGNQAEKYYAVAVTGDITNTGSLTNAGAISIDMTADTTALAYGIFIRNEMAGTLINSGDIDVTLIGNNATDATAYGIFIRTDLSGTLTNTSTGSITASVTGFNDHTYGAYGINVKGNVTGSLTNDGEILAASSATSENATAFGIYIGGNLLDGSITNNGTITTTTSGGLVGGSGDAYFNNGIYIDGSVDSDSQIINTGLLSANTIWSDESGVNMGGIHVGTDLAGTIVNSGDIQLSADIGGTGSMYMNGLWVEGNVTGSITNTSTGVITVTGTDVGTSGRDPFVYGISADSTLSGTVTNAGTISLTATADSGSATANGIYIGDMTSGALVTNSGTITATATADTNVSAAGIFVNSVMDGTITNSGSISGVANLAGDGYSLNLNSGTGTVSNQAGGVLTGNLNAGGTIAVSNAGRIELPTGAGAHVGGNYTQTAGGVLEVGAVSSSDFATLTVDGTASFAAGTGIFVNVDNANTLAEGNQLLNVISAGTLNATSFRMTDNYALWNFSSSIDGNTVDLTTIPGLTILEAAQLGGASSAAFGVAGALDVINADTPSSDMSVALASLNGMTETEIAAAAEQLMPALSGGVGHLTNQIAGVLPDAVDERLNSTRGLSSGDSLMSDHKAWVKPFGNWTDQDDHKGVYGYEADSYGVALGTDADTGAGWRVGTAFAYSNSDVDSNAPNFIHQLDMDTYQIGVYGSHQMDADTALDIKAAWGMSSYDSSRRIDFVSPVRTATADYDSWHLRLNAKLSHAYSINAATSLASYLRADYIYVDVDSYRESGAGALNLNVHGDTEDAFILGVGADLNHSIDDNLTLKANLGVGYDVSSDQSSLDASFVNDGAVFSTKGLKPDPLILRAGVGAVFANIKDVEITGRYDIEARQDYRNQGVSVNLSWKF